MLTVQASSGLFKAVQHDGTNGAEIVAALGALNPVQAGGVLALTAFYRRGALLLSGHRFFIGTNQWVVWQDADNQYVIGVFTPAEFADQWVPTGGGGGVDSVNGQTGVVVLNAAAVGAVASVNGETGPAVVLDAADVGAVASVNGESGPAVVLDAADVGAVPRTVVASKTYGTDGAGLQATFDYSQSGTASSFAQRTPQGQLRAVTLPDADGNAAGTDLVNRTFANQFRTDRVTSSTLVNGGTRTLTAADDGAILGTLATPAVATYTVVLPSGLTTYKMVVVKFLQGVNALTVSSVGNTVDYAPPSVAPQDALIYGFNVAASQWEILGRVRDTMYIPTGSAIPGPQSSYLFQTVPLTSDPNLMQVAIGNNAASLVMWLNEVGHYRAEQRAPYDFDHLMVLIASFAGGSGRLIRFERRDAGNNRVEMGAINIDGRLMTSLYPFTLITTIDPGATGKYSILVAANVAAPGVQRTFDDRVTMQGRIAVTAAGVVSGDVIMRVPAGFFPLQQQWLNTMNTGGIAIPCEVLLNGDVVARRTQAGAANMVYENQTYKTSNI